jgi:hypothetical protein
MFVVLFGTRNAVHITISFGVYVVLFSVVAAPIVVLNAGPLSAAGPPGAVHLSSRARRGFQGSAGWARVRRPAGRARPCCRAHRYAEHR